MCCRGGATGRGTVGWTSRSPSPKDLWQTNVVPLGGDCLPPWSGAEVAWPNLAKKTTIMCLEVLLDLSNFTGGLPSVKSQTED